MELLEHVRDLFPEKELTDSEYFEAVLKRLGGHSQFIPLLPKPIHELYRNLMGSDDDWQKACGIKAEMKGNQTSFQIQDRDNLLVKAVRKLHGQDIAPEEYITLLQSVAAKCVTEYECQWERFKQICYERYQLHWMLMHGHSLMEFATSFLFVVNEYEQLSDIEDILDQWECSIGFGGAVYASKREFLDVEFRDPNYMKQILTEKQYVQYCKYSKELILV